MRTLKQKLEYVCNMFIYYFQNHKFHIRNTKTNKFDRIFIKLLRFGYKKSLQIICYHD